MRGSLPGSIYRPPVYWRSILYCTNADHRCHLGKGDPTWKHWSYMLPHYGTALRSANQLPSLHCDEENIAMCHKGLTLYSPNCFEENEIVCASFIIGGHTDSVGCS